MPFRFPVITQEPVYVKQSELSPVSYGRFRTVSRAGAGDLGPVPQGRAWNVISIYMAQTQQGDELLMSMYRQVAGDTHLLWSRSLTGSSAVGSHGVDSHLGTTMQTFPLPDVELQAGDFLRVAQIAGGPIIQVEMHVSERELRE